MQITTPPKKTAMAGLRALKTVATADGELRPLERQYIEAVRDHILKIDVSLNDLDIISATQLAEEVQDQMFRERIIRSTIMIALLDAEITKKEEAIIDDFARALETDKAPIRTMKRITGDHLRMLKLDILRRAFIGKRIKTQFEQKGFQGIMESVLALLGKEIPELRDKYHALENKAEGTLGRRYWEFTKENDFSFPGEIGGPPEPLVFHDCVHILADYGTSSAEEAAVVAFQGGFQNYDPFHTFLFVIAQYQLGIQISPVVSAERRAISNIEEIIKSYTLGTKCNRDLSDGWNPWLDFDFSVEELRHRYNIVLRA